MPGLYEPISAHQAGVLQWIADGCPDGVMAGYSYKTTAVALQSRHLVVVTRKRGGWQAAMTAAGHHYLVHGCYPPGHWKTPPRPATSRRLADPSKRSPPPPTTV